MIITGGNLSLPSASTIMGTASAPAGEMTIYGNNLRLLPSGAAQSALLTENIGSTSFSNTMRISGVSTINGVAFPPPTPGVNPNVIVSTLTAATYISTPNVYTNIITGTGVIIGSTPGQGITIGTDATQVNMTADVVMNSPYLLSANELTDCVQASISSIINLSTINAAPYNLGTANDTIPALTCWGTANAAQTLANNAQINAGVAQATANTAILQSGTVSVAGATGSIGMTGGTGISVSTAGSTITISATGSGPTGPTGPQGSGAIGPTGPTGDGVTSFNTLTGAITLVAGTNISLTPVGNVITVNQINIPVTNRASGTTPLLITATTFATAQTIGNLSLPTTGIYDIDVWAVSVITSDQNAQRDMNLFITINGTQVGQVFTSTLSGIGHFLSMPNQCTLIAAAAGTQTILLKGYASVSGHLTVNSFQLSAIGNLA